MGTHKETVFRCAVCHYHGKGADAVPAPQCIKCKHCGEWIRPEDMGEQCPENTSIRGKRVTQIILDDFENEPESNRFRQAIYDDSDSDSKS